MPPAVHVPPVPWTTILDRGRTRRNGMEAVLEVVLLEALAIVVRLAWNQLAQWLAERHAARSTGLDLAAAI